MTTRRTLLTTVVAFSASLVSTMSDAQALPCNIKLNGSLVAGGDASLYQVSADSSRVVYLADQDADEVRELYSVPVSGGAPTRLNGSLIPGGEVSNCFISADSSRVVYRADQDTDHLFELYSVSISGGASTKLNGALPPGTSGPNSCDFRISADNSRVVYIAQQETFAVYEIYSVSISGGVTTKLNGPLPPGGTLQPCAFEISADSSRVVYRATQGAAFEIYSVSITGGVSTKLNGALVSGGQVDRFQITGDSSRVVYSADQDSDGVTEIYSVLISGGVSTKLNGALVPGGQTGSFQISADSSRVVYPADQDTDDVQELYSVQITGGASTKLNGALVPGGQTGFFQISADSSRVVYQADQDSDGVTEIYSVPITGGASTKLNGVMVPGGQASVFQISGDSSRVVYRADQDADEVRELYSVPISGGAPTKLNGSLVLGGDVPPMGNLQISADSSRVVYRADQDTDDVFELYSVPLSGGVSTKLNEAPVLGGDVSPSLFQISTDNSRVFYQADQDTNDVFEIYVVHDACEDGDACTSNDRCSAGTCVGGPTVNCDDHDPCTADSCDSATGCIFTPFAPPEVCNGLDDNCNGDIDEPPDPNDPNRPWNIPCATGLEGECAPGMLRCISDPVLQQGSLQCMPIHAARPELCNGVDDNCNTIIDDGEDSDGDGWSNCADNCPYVANADQANSDEDAYGNRCDCAPADPTNPQAPEVASYFDNAPQRNSLRLRQISGQTEISWDAGGVAGPFRLYRGWRNPGVAWTYTHYCTGHSEPTSPFLDPRQPGGFPANPGRGSLFYYLVTREGCPESIPGTMGTGGIEGGAIPNLSPCPVPTEDADTDGIEEAIDNCPGHFNPPGTPGQPQDDEDGDGIGYVLIAGEEFCDNCRYMANPGQENLDGDGFGDVCDDDIDGDGVPQGTGTNPCTGCNFPTVSCSSCDDNCPFVPNGDNEDHQQDTNPTNGIGDACEARIR